MRKRERERDGTSERIPLGEGHPLHGQPAPRALRDGHVPLSPPRGNRRPSSGGGGTRRLSSTPRLFLGTPAGFRYRGRAATARQEKDRLTRRYNGNARSSGVPLARHRSLPINLAPSPSLPLSRSHSRSRITTHHRIRRTAVRRVSAHIPGGEAEHRPSRSKRAGRRGSLPSGEATAD